MLKRVYSFDENGQHEEDNGSRNMIIHGDNLVALKSLLPRYEGKVKCIYIDPPYNTGNEGWVYNDNVNDPKIKKWLGAVVGKEGEDLSRHDKWLCMMYPRLQLLQKLLREDGVIFISIDDAEVYSLKLICDEIFGVNNFVSQFVWYTEGHTDNQNSITHVHEYILCYAKRKSCLTFNNVVDPSVPEDSKIRRSFAENSVTKNGQKNPASSVTLPIGFPCDCDEINFPATTNADKLCQEANQQGYISRAMTQKYQCTYPVRLNEMKAAHGALTAPCEVYSGWANKSKLLKFIQGGCVPYSEGDGEMRFFLTRNGVIYYRKERKSNFYIQSVLQQKGTTETNKYVLEGMGIHFDYPKPVALVNYLISMFVNEGDIVLDSFAGSGTTAHAVLNMNMHESGNRQFILIELGDYADTVTAERVKCVIKGYTKGNKEVKGMGGSFSFYELGERLLTEEGNLNEAVELERIRSYIWYMETRTDMPNAENGNPHFLGSHRGTAYYFYYEPAEVTVLNHDFLATIPEKMETTVIYADRCTLAESTLVKYGIVFKKIPRDITKL